MSSRDEDFAEFASARWMPLVRAAMAIGCRLPDAEDAAQTALIKAYVSWAKVDKADNRDAYLSRILINVCTDSFRKRSRREVPAASIPGATESDLERHIETADALRRAMGSLNQGQREVLALRFYIQLTESEIASTLNISPGTVKSRLSRALERLSHHPDLAQHGDAND